MEENPSGEASRRYVVMKFGACRFHKVQGISRLVQKLLVSLKSDKNNGYFT
jgi:hypothetical protein